MNASWRPKCALALAAAAALSLSVPRSALGSSHSEAPLISLDPSVDNADVYFFLDPGNPGNAVLLATFNGLSNPASGPNYKSFAENARYDLHVDSDGDGVEDVTYRFEFTNHRRTDETFLYNTGPIASVSDPNLNVYQTYTVTKIFGPSAHPAESRTSVVGGGDTAPFYTVPWNIGPKSYPNNGYGKIADGIYETVDGAKVAAGPRADPFFVDLGMIFDLVNLDAPGRPGVGLGNHGGGKNTLNGFNVMAIMLEVPVKNLTKTHRLPTSASDPEAILGMWSSASRRSMRVLNGDGTTTESGDWVQVSRLGEPLVNEVLITLGDKDRWNASEPKDDAAFVEEYYRHPGLAAALHALFGVSVPAEPREDIVAALATGIPGLNQRPGEVEADEIRLNVAIPPVPIAQANPLGVLGGDLAGFPNGRRPCDDVVDIELRVVAGVLVDGFNVAPNNELGDGVDTPDPACAPGYPFMLTPYPAFTDQHAGPARPTHD
ncbi:MAG TPA: DUF4331 domain-containing protein [Thermoanaerobaculia bacterium]|nr:DUF4331 domain-containing protein [Thermoanaerobaculia bacterium]